ncbi:Anoctamin-5 [Mortierella polycephala]|uniref:Anoctamin-5 n=1 Tax=Mortierella polycephala TaxID=41804 RepID=A0A9P6U2E5_9FUNG|nr:Anoctamin-5 [Mortierella polycephala]
MSSPDNSNNHHAYINEPLPHVQPNSTPNTYARPSTGIGLNNSSAVQHPDALLATVDAEQNYPTLEHKDEYQAGPDSNDTRNVASPIGVSSSISNPSRTRHHKRLASVSLPQLGTPSRGLFTVPPLGTSFHHNSTQRITRSDMDIRSEYLAKGNRRKHEGQQLSPHAYNRQRGPWIGPPSPTSPAAPSSTRSIRSCRSSIRRTPATTQEAAAVILADKLNIKVISRSMSSYRVVHILYQTDVDLFDAIQGWKDSHPTLTVDDAIDAFATARGSDALAHLVYSTEAFDIILKYNASHKDIDPIFENHIASDRSRRTSMASPQPHSQTLLQGSGPPGRAGSEKGFIGSTASVPIPASPVGGEPRNPRSPSPRRIPNLRNSLSSALSRSSSRTSQVTCPRNQDTSNSAHVSVAMSSVAIDTDVDNATQQFRFLQPLNYTADLSPNMQPLAEAASNAQLAMDDQGGPAQTQIFHSTMIDQTPRTMDRTHREQGRRIRRTRPSKSKMREWKIQLLRRDFQLALLKEGLFLELEKSINSDAVYVKIIAPFWRLEDEAQKTNYKADLASTVHPSIPYASRMFPNVTRLFPCLRQPGLEQRREAVLFKTARLTDFHLAESGRRWSDVVRHAGAIRGDGFHVGSQYGTDGRPGFFQTSRRGYLVNSIMIRTESRNQYYGNKMSLRSALRQGAYQKLYALHDGSFKIHSESIKDANYRAQLRVKWVKRFWTGQPLDMVNAYYGERIGIYFGWLGHYTKWLTLPAVVGTMVFVYGVINAASLNKLDATPNVLFAIFDNVLTMPFALFMSIWSSVYIEFWKRANQYYAFRWNMSDYERVELPRTEFRATKARISPVTGKRELYYPLYWKALRILASSVAVFIAVSVVVGSVASLMIFKAWCRNHVGGAYTTVVATALLNLIIIIVLGEIWCRLAEWLTDKENHKYTDAYEDSLIIKRYLFDFTNMYATLFYYAFFKAPFGGKIFMYRPDLQDGCLYDACITELSVQLAVVFIGKQFLNGLFEMVFPWIKRTWNRKEILAEKALKRRKLLETRKSARAPQWVKDDDLPNYQGRILKCYRKTVIQFGFCTLFVTAFPVAPAFALINNWIDIRMEAFRLLTQYRRPIAYRAQDIGMWEKIMEFISFTSVITNAAIIAFSSLWIKQNLFAKYLHATEEGELLAARIGFILVFEHVVFLFKIVLRATIPSVPLTIKLAVQRSKYMNQVASEGLDSEMDDDLDLYIDSGSESDPKNDNFDFVSDVASDNGSEVQGTARGQMGPSEEATNVDKKEHRKQGRGLGLRRLWRVGDSKRKNNRYQEEQESKLRQKRERNDPLPTIQETSPSQRTSNVLAHRRRVSQDGMMLSPMPKDETAYNTEHGTGVECWTTLPFQGQEYGQFQQQAPPHLYQHHYHAPSTSSKLDNQQGDELRRPMPQRVSTDMDGEWVVLEETRM